MKFWSPYLGDKRTRLVHLRRSSRATVKSISNFPSLIDSKIESGWPHKVDIRSFKPPPSFLMLWVILPAYKLFVSVQLYRTTTPGLPAPEYAPDVSWIPAAGDFSTFPVMSFTARSIIILYRFPPEGRWSAVMCADFTCVSDVSAGLSSSPAAAPAHSTNYAP